jgi:hypothetical protein
MFGCPDLDIVLFHARQFDLNVKLAPLFIDVERGTCEFMREGVEWAPGRQQRFHDPLAFVSQIRKSEPPPRRLARSPYVVFAVSHLRPSLRN